MISKGINIKDTFVLFYCIDQQNINLFNYFYSFNLNINKKNIFGENLLHRAILQKSLILVQLLINLQINIFDVNNQKQTPFEYAKIQKCEDIIEFLLNLLKIN